MVKSGENGTNRFSVSAQVNFWYFGVIFVSKDPSFQGLKRVPPLDRSTISRFFHISKKDPFLGHFGDKKIYFPNLQRL